MSKLAIAMAVLLGYAVQASIVPYIAIWGARPDLLLIVLVHAALMRGPTTGVIVGFASGFLLDVASPQTLGANALARSVVGFAVGHVWESVERGSLLAGALAVFGATILHDAIYLAIVALTARESFPSSLLTLALPAAVYTTAVAAPLLMLLGRFVRPRRSARRAY
jgi:rod shape-determining protein MreD